MHSGVPNTFTSYAGTAMDLRTIHGSHDRTCSRAHHGLCRSSTRSVSTGPVQKLTPAHPVELLQWRDGPKGPEHLVRFGQHRRNLRPSPLYEEAWLTRAGMRAHHVSRDVLVIAKKKEESGRGYVKRESLKKEEEDEGLELDVAEEAQVGSPGVPDGTENGEDDKEDEDVGGAEGIVAEAEDTSYAASRHSNEGQSPSGPAADRQIETEAAEL